MDDLSVQSVVHILLPDGGCPPAPNNRRRNGFNGGSKAYADQLKVISEPKAKQILIDP